MRGKREDEGEERKSRRGEERKRRGIKTGGKKYEGERRGWREEWKNRNKIMKEGCKWLNEVEGEERRNVREEERRI